MVEDVTTHEFKTVMSEFVKKMGFTIESSQILEDGSIDYIAITQNPMGAKVVSLIRASAYVRLVGEGDIKSLTEKMFEFKAVRAAYITTSGFSEEAVEYARDKPVSLINKYQLIDSIEKRGLLTDKSLMESLEGFGMGEKHYQGIEQSFIDSKIREEIKAYFVARASKTEKPLKPSLKYAPVEVYLVVRQKNMWTADSNLRSIETEDQVYVNLNNLDIYYILQKRKRSGTERMLMRSDIILKIFQLPPGPKESLMHLLEHGDLPLDTINSKELSILKNKNVIEVYEGRRRKGSGLTDYATQLLDGLIETINLIVTEVTSGISGMGEESSSSSSSEKPVVKSVAAQVNMPHIYHGIYDLGNYLDVTRGLKHEGEIDTMKYTSKQVGQILKSVFGGNVTAEGIIFMPYYRTQYLSTLDEHPTKSEVLFSPRFKKDEEISEKKKPQTKSDEPAKTRIHGLKPIPGGGRFKLIR